MRARVVAERVAVSLTLVSRASRCRPDQPSVVDRQPDTPSVSPTSGRPRRTTTAPTRVAARPAPSTGPSTSLVRSTPSSVGSAGDPRFPALGFGRHRRRPLRRGTDLRPDDRRLGRNRGGRRHAVSNPPTRSRSTPMGHRCQRCGRRCRRLDVRRRAIGADRRARRRRSGRRTFSIEVDYSGRSGGRASST